MSGIANSYFNSPANPGSPVSPLNPGNPASPLNPLNHGTSNWHPGTASPPDWLPFIGGILLALMLCLEVSLPHLCVGALLGKRTGLVTGAILTAVWCLLYLSGRFGLVSGLALVIVPAAAVLLLVRAVLPRPDRRAPLGEDSK